MRRRTWILAGTVVGLLTLALAGVFFVDQGAKNKIPAGVQISGIDVGGLSKAAATQKIEGTLVSKLKQPVVVRSGNEHWTLTPKTAQSSVNVDGAVNQAKKLATDGNAFTRLKRNLFNEKLDVNIDPVNNYSRQAVVDMAKRVAKSVDTQAVNADVTFAGGKLDVKQGANGKKTDTKWLERQLRKALRNPEAERNIVAKVSVIKPKVTSDSIRESYGTVLVANRNTFKLTLYKDFKVSKTYGISVGKAGNETPAGRYSIQSKDPNPAWHVPNSEWAGKLAGTVVPAGAPNNPIKARWLGIYNGVGIHGTSDDASIGSNASHGCLRMHVPDVIDLFPRVPIGAPIWIV